MKIYVFLLKYKFKFYKFRKNDKISIRLCIVNLELKGFIKELGKYIFHLFIKNMAF